jgi:hypothetical protein
VSENSVEHEAVPRFRLSNHVRHSRPASVRFNAMGMLPKPVRLLQLRVHKTSRRIPLFELGGLPCENSFERLATRLVAAPTPTLTIAVHQPHLAS